MDRIRMLRAGVAIVALAASGHVVAAQAQQRLQVATDANRIWVRAGQSPLLQYRYGDVPFKPYIKELYTPGGQNVLLDAPPDHLHHHGLMFAVAVDGVNFWEEAPTAGRQRPFPETVRTELEGWMATFSTNLTWVDAAGKEEKLREHRIIRVCQPAIKGATVVFWQSLLFVPPTKTSVTLSGSHYFGLGMRFVRAMDGGEFFNADGREGTVFRGDERLVQSDWCAYTAAIEGKPVTVAMLAVPGNSLRPTTWFTMAKPFAYLSGTVNLHKEPLSVVARKEPWLQYAIVVWDGKVDRDQVNQVYQWCRGEDSRVRKAKEGAQQNEEQK